MKNLKILVSLIGLSMAFSFVNASAMERNVNSVNKQSESGVGKDGNALHQTGEKCSVYIDLGYELAVSKERYLKIKKFIENEFIELGDLDLKNFAFDYTSADLFKFYKEIYNKVLNSEEEIALDTKYEKYFTLLSPKKLENISFKDEGGIREIKLEFKKDAKFDEGEISRLQRLKSRGNDSFDLVNSGSYGVAMLKQIVLVYLEIAKNNGNFQGYNGENGYISSEMKLDCYGNIADKMKKAMEPQICTQEAVKKWCKRGIKFDNTSKDLTKFYAKVCDMFGGKLLNVNFSTKNLIHFLFDPQNVKDITVQDGGLSAVFKFDIANIKKCYGHEHTAAIDDIFANFELYTKYDVCGIFAAKVILLYLKCVNELQKEGKSYEQLINEYSKEIDEKEKNKLKELDEFKNKEFEMNTASTNPLFDSIAQKVESVINESFTKKEVLYNGTSEDLLKFYERIFNVLINKKILLSSPEYPKFILFSPGNIDGITVKDDGLTAVFKFNINNIVNYLKNKDYKITIVDDMIEVLNDFDAKNRSDYIATFPKQIVSIYFERAKKKKEYKLEKENQLKNLEKFKNKEFELNIGSKDKNSERTGNVIKNKIKSVVDKNIKEKGGGSEDILKFYEEVYDELIKQKIINLKLSPCFVLFSPENIENITVKDDGLSAVFKFNINNIIDQVKNKKNNLYNVNDINKILNDFDEENKKQYFAIFTKQIVSAYIERIKNNKEENKLEAKKEAYKKEEAEEKKEIVKKYENVEDLKKEYDEELNKKEDKENFEKADEADNKEKNKEEDKKEEKK